MRLWWYNVGWFYWIFFLQIIVFSFLVHVCDPVHDVEAIHVLCLLIAASGNLLRNLQFHGHHSYFSKDFQMLVAAKEGKI